MTASFTTTFLDLQLQAIRPTAAPQLETSQQKKCLGLGAQDSGKFCFHSNRKKLILQNTDVSKFKVQGNANNKTNSSGVYRLSMVVNHFIITIASVTSHLRPYPVCEVGLEPPSRNAATGLTRPHFYLLAHKQGSLWTRSKPTATMNFPQNTILEAFSFPSPTLRAGK